MAVTSVSRRNIRLGKLIVLLLLGCLGGYSFTVDRAEDNIKGQQLTFEEYAAGFEDHKAKLMKPALPVWGGILIFNVMALAFFGVYELLGTLLGMLIGLIWKPPETGDGVLQEHPPEEEDRNNCSGTDLSISFGRVNVIAIVSPLILGVVVIVPYGLIWGMEPFIEGFKQILWLPAFLLVFLVSIVAHEALHGLGFVWFGRCRWRDLQFGIKWEKLVAYATSKSAMSASAYRGVTALPGVVLGVLPVLLGLAIGSSWLLFYGFIMLSAASGDGAILWVIRNVDGKAQIVDQADRAGCRVLDEAYSGKA